MNLEPLRAALKAEADAAAERRRAEAETAGARRLAGAQAQAAAIVEQARVEALRAAVREGNRRRAAASRRARELRLEAQRSLIDELRVRARGAALELRTDPRYRELLDRLSETARSQLGPAAELEIDPPHAGGVIARSGSHTVDYSLPVLVDRTIAELDGAVEGLWR